jgi:predicted SAM-dependent methyltransferase
MSFIRHIVPRYWWPWLQESKKLFSRSVYPARRGFGLWDRSLTKRYLRDQPVRKLQLGCGRHPLDGWLNSDNLPRGYRVIHLDATRRFPLPDHQFDYIFSEHMIEHIPYAYGLCMLTECHRVMRDNATLRIATPDLAFFIGLCTKPLSHEERSFLQWITDRYMPEAPRHGDPVFVLNHHMRRWGHQFLYDEKTLRAALERVGFTSVRRCQCGESPDPHLRNLEFESRQPAGILRMETLVLEAVK